MVTKRQVRDAGQITRPAASKTEILGILPSLWTSVYPEFRILRRAPGRGCAKMDFTHRHKSSTVEISLVSSDCLDSHCPNKDEQ